MKRHSLLIPSLALLLAGCGGTPGGKGAAAQRLNGGGSSFVWPMMTKWTAVYDREHGVKVDYSSAGSSNGIQQMTAKTLDFGCTDAPMNEEQLQKAARTGGPVLHIPLVMGGIVPIYNLPEVEQTLNFSGPVLADIYLGKVTKWNDSALRALNPGVALPDRDIGVVRRAEGSGSTYIWTEYLSAVSPEWKEKVGKGTMVNWPVGVGQKDTSGVSGHVARTRGAIGYVELLYALQTKLKYGAVRNRAGVFVLANLQTVTAAADQALASIPEDLRYSLVDAAGKDAYPLSGTTWVVFYQKQPRATGEALVSFLHWLTHDGQQYCNDLHYATLPKGLVERVEKKLQTVEFVD
jgi:phosphate ABC transporter phosphate-binding protein